MNVILLILVAAIAATAFATGGVLLGRRLIRRHVARGHHEVLVGLFQTCGTLHAVFLAFLVVAVWQAYDEARGNVADEASALATLYRASTGMVPEMGTQLQKLIREYVDAVIHDEWTIQAQTGGASPRARAAGLAMYRVFGQENAAARQTDAAIDSAALQIIGEIQSDRNKRTLEAGRSLHTVIWFAAIGSGAIFLSMGFVLFMERPAPQVIMTSLMASTIALLLCITFVLSRPFVGPMALQPDPFAHSLEVFDSVDATP
jgi:hypothetical protein